METKKLAPWAEVLAQLPDGTEVATWDGGNDSGQVDVESDFSEHEEDIASSIYHALGYGSWAGSFSSTGTVTKQSGENGPYLDLCGTYQNQEDFTYDDENAETKKWVIPAVVRDVVDEVEVVERLPGEGDGDLDGQELVLMRYKDGPIPDEAAEGIQRICKEASDFIREWFEEADCHGYDNLTVEHSYETGDNVDELEIKCEGGHYHQLAFWFVCYDRVSHRAHKRYNHQRDHKDYYPYRPERKRLRFIHHVLLVTSGTVPILGQLL